MAPALLTIVACAGDTRADATDAKVAGPMRVTFAGVGRVRAGMTLPEAATALGTPVILPPSADSMACTNVSWSGAPAGVSLMVEQRRVTRVDVRAPTIATAAGARVGDTEDRIQSLYPGRVITTPHKYTSGHYLTIAPGSPADSAFRLVFETDAGRVTRFRSGQRPQVEYVEGCS